MNARSCLGVAEGVSQPAAEQSHRRGTKNRGQFEWTAMRPSESGDEGHDGEVREVITTGGVWLNEYIQDVLDTLTLLLLISTPYGRHNAFFC